MGFTTRVRAFFATGGMWLEEDAAQAALGGFDDGLEAGALNLADMATFRSNKSLHDARERKWRELGLKGTWTETIANASGGVGLAAGAGAALLSGGGALGITNVGSTAITVKGAATYLGTQAGIGLLETTFEAGITYFTGSEETWNNFSFFGSWGKNSVINVLTGGIGSKAEWGWKFSQWSGRAIAGWGVRQGVEIAGDTTYDIYQGRDGSLH